MPSSCQSSLFCRWPAVSWSNPAMEKLLHNFSMMMTTCHCIERWHIDQVLKSLPYHHVIPTYFPQIANQWKNKTLQSKQFQSLVSPIGLVTPIKIVHHWKLCIILFLGKKWTFCRISVLSNASLGGFSVLLNHESPLVGSKGNAHWAGLLSNFLLLFVIQQFHCQTFWFKWCGRFSEYFLAFCFFSIKTDSLSVSLSWVTGTNIKTHPIQCNTHIK